jgi:spermidine/putrescine ABC transporter ATP-binding subunit
VYGKVDLGFLDSVSLELDNVHKTYGKTIAVNGFSVSVGTGEFLTLLGPSGCGKTTILRIIAGFASPDSGNIYIHGQLVNKKPPRERNTAMVFQSYALFPHMTAYENIAYGLKIRKLSKAEIVQRVKNVLELVRLSGFESRYPRQLSGGQQQRVALARALVIEPDVLLLDEPLSNLDFKLRQQMRLEIKSIQKRVNVTTVYVTHDQGEALTMSDRVAVLNNGNLVQIAPPLELYSHPAAEFVADFIGESNILRARILAVSDSRAVMATDNALELQIGISRSAKFKSGDRVSLSIRPERIHVLRCRPSSPVNTFQADVESIAFIGSIVRYYVRLLNGQRMSIEEKNDGSAIWSVGDRVYIHVEPEDCFPIPES